MITATEHGTEGTEGGKAYCLCRGDDEYEKKDDQRSLLRRGVSE